MRTYDLSPLLRSSIGFDRFDWLFDAASRLEDGSTGYPPYNIEKLEGDKYAVTLAVAGFAQDELNIVQHDTTLVVSGKGSEQPKAGEDVRFLHRGIARRAFERRFQLADYVKVVGANLDNGLLTVELERVIPEAMKPRKIEIARSTAKQVQPQVIDAKAA